MSVTGYKELARQLKKLPVKLGAKALRSAAMTSTTPVVKAMKQAAPRGKKFHKTYKGNIAGPGYLSRSIKRSSRIKSGRVRVMIGVKREAFYGVLFVEKGTKPHDIPDKTGKQYQHYVPRRNGKGFYQRAVSKRRSSGSWRKKALKIGNRYAASVKHPGARAKPWFVKSFVKNKNIVLRNFKRNLQRNIKKLS